MLNNYGVVTICIKTTNERKPYRWEYYFEILEITELLAAVIVLLYMRTFIDLYEEYARQLPLRTDYVFAIFKPITIWYYVI